MTLKEINFSENKKIIIQEYNKAIEPYSQDDIQISVREWERDQWKIGEPLEMHFKKGTSFLDLSNKLKLYFPDIKEEYLSVYKVTNFGLYMNDLEKCKFENLYDKSDYILDKFPFFLSQDGQMLM